MDKEISCELKDLEIAIQRFCHANKHHVVFISSFAVFDPKTRKVTENILDVYGQKEVLQPMLDDLKRIVNEEAKNNSHNFVNI